MTNLAEGNTKVKMNSKQNRNEKDVILRYLTKRERERMEPCDQSYKHSTIANYDSSVVNARNLFLFTTL